MNWKQFVWTENAARCFEGVCCGQHSCTAGWQLNLPLVPPNQSDLCTSSQKCQHRRAWQWLHSCKEWSQASPSQNAADHDFQSFWNFKRKTEEEHKTRLIGDSMIRGQLTEFCGRSRKEYKGIQRKSRQQQPWWAWHGCLCKNMNKLNEELNNK